MKILVTGGYGFIGSNFIIRYLNSHKKSKIFNIDAMKVGSNSLSLKNIKNQNYHFIKGNICNKKLIEKLIQKVDCVVNFAAESHVDRSIVNPNSFVRTNILGVQNILDAIKRKKSVKFLQISTDEVYGEILKGSFKEYEELDPSNPYSASKGSAELLIRSYARTYDLDVKITRCVNNYGIHQYPEKLIPKAILCALRDEPIPLHGNGKSRRQWIHVFDHCDALIKILSRWNKTKSVIYNIGGNHEASNIDIVKRILELMNKSEHLISFVNDRPGQDKRYAINGNLIKRHIGFKPKIEIENGLKSTVNWYVNNEEWWKKISFNKIKNPTPWM